MDNNNTIRMVAYFLAAFILTLAGGLFILSVLPHIVLGE
jgi:hypothetical protein